MSELAANVEPGQVVSSSARPPVGLNWGGTVGAGGSAVRVVRGVVAAGCKRAKKKKKKKKKKKVRQVSSYKLLARRAAQRRRQIVWHCSRAGGQPVQPPTPPCVQRRAGAPTQRTVFHVVCGVVHIQTIVVRHAGTLVSTARR